MTWLNTAPDEAWAQGQISHYPGWYSQLMYITYPIPRVLSSTTASTAMLSKAKRPVEIDDESLIKDQRAASGMQRFKFCLGIN